MNIFENALIGIAATVVFATGGWCLGLAKPTMMVLQTINRPDKTLLFTSALVVVVLEAVLIVIFSLINDPFLPFAAVLWTIALLYMMKITANIQLKRIIKRINGG